MAPAEPAPGLTLISGGTEQSEYVFEQDRINLGRGREVLSKTHGVLRE